ncbi:hypothetical protein BaRGS_00018581 [Batillaria attramentaria]|uniref:Globin n=1 Tax=Batillaria attramentaria TaxID=370345 RepID=A0ABD0KT67_9CAEN
MAMFGLSEFGLQPIELQRGSHLHRFVVKVCDAITVCVDNLDNSAVVDKLLYDLGCSHYRYGAKEEYFEAIQHGVLHSLELRLGPQFDDKAKSAWTAVLILISQKMIEAMRQQKADKQLGGGHNEEEEKTDNSGEGGSGGQEEARRETDA